MVHLNFQDSSYSKCFAISNTFLFLFSNKMLVIRAGNHKMLVRIANKEGFDQTASSLLGFCCLSGPIWQATSVQNFRTYTIISI